MEKKIAIPLIAVLVLVATATVAYYKILLPREQEWKVEIVANGQKKTYRISQLEQKASPLWIDLYEANITAVSLWHLLQEADIDVRNVQSFTPYGSDGYHREIEGDALEFTYIQIIEEDFIANNGPLRLICETKSVKHWVKFLARIEIEVRG